MKAKKGIAIFLVVVCMMAIFSSFFVYAEVHHDCDGEDCPVCAILLVVKTVGKFVVALFLLLSALWMLSFCARFVAGKVDRFLPFTPVLLKTKLSC